jgi:hypothetical protein
MQIHIFVNFRPQLISGRLEQHSLRGSAHSSKTNAGDDLANRHIPICRVLATERSSARSLVRTFSCRSHPSLEILVDCFVLLVQGAPLQREIRLLGQIFEKFGPCTLQLFDTAFEVPSRIPFSNPFSFRHALTFRTVFGVRTSTIHCNASSNQGRVLYPSA